MTEDDILSALTADPPVESYGQRFQRSLSERLMARGRPLGTLLGALLDPGPGAAELQTLKLGRALKMLDLQRRRESEDRQRQQFEWDKEDRLRRKSAEAEAKPLKDAMQLLQTAQLNEGLRGLVPDETRTRVVGATLPESALPQTMDEAGTGVAAEKLPDYYRAEVVNTMSAPNDEFAKARREAIQRHRVSGGLIPLDRIYLNVRGLNDRSDAGKVQQELLRFQLDMAKDSDSPAARDAWSNRAAMTAAALPVMRGDLTKRVDDWLAAGEKIQRAKRGRLNMLTGQMEGGTSSVTDEKKFADWYQEGVALKQKPDLSERDIANWNNRASDEALYEVALGSDPTQKVKVGPNQSPEVQAEYERALELLRMRGKPDLRAMAARTPATVGAVLEPFATAARGVMLAGEQGAIAAAAEADRRARPFIVTMNGQPVGEPVAAAPAAARPQTVQPAEIPPAPPVQQRVVGHVYLTPRGPLRWAGNGWMAQ